MTPTKKTATKAPAKAAEGAGQTAPSLRSRQAGRSLGHDPAARRRRARPAVASVQEHRRGRGSREADPALRAAREVRGEPCRDRPAGERRAGRPRELRHVRPDRRAHEVRARSRQQVRDLRDPPHQGRDHRRAASDGLGAAVGPVQGPRDREGPHRSRVDAEASADRAGDGRAARHLAPRAARRRLADLVRLGARARRAGLGRRRPRRAGLADRHARRPGHRPDVRRGVAGDAGLLAAAINELSEREKIVVTLYYFEGLTLAEIGEILGVTESRVCQIHTKAVGGLRGQLTEVE